MRRAHAPTMPHMLPLPLLPVLQLLLVPLPPLLPLTVQDPRWIWRNQRIRYRRKLQGSGFDANSRPAMVNPVGNSAEFWPAGLLLWFRLHCRLPGCCTGPNGVLTRSGFGSIAVCMVAAPCEKIAVSATHHFSTDCSSLFLTSTALLWWTSKLGSS